MMAAAAVRAEKITSQNTEHFPTLLFSYYLSIVIIYRDLMIYLNLVVQYFQAGNKLDSISTKMLISAIPVLIFIAFKLSDIYF